MRDHLSCRLLRMFFFRSRQGYYTTGVSLSPDITFPGATDLVGRFEPAANILGFGYTVYTIDSSSKLVIQTYSLGPVQPSWSIVQDGSVLDHVHYLSGVPGQSLNGYQLTLDQSFLVAMRLIDIPPTGVFPERFGWARLKYTSTGLQIVDQATALGGNGIIAGTTTVLPEPCRCGSICLWHPVSGFRTVFHPFIDRLLTVY